MRLVMGSGAGAWVTVGFGVVGRCAVGEGWGSLVHADMAAVIAKHATAVRAIRSRVFRVRSDAMKADLICVVFLESCAK